MLQMNVVQGVTSGLKRLPKGGVLALTGLLIFLIGAVDYATGNASLLLFYLGPVAIATWFVGFRAGGFAALLVALVTLGGNVSPSLPLALWHSVSAGAIGVLVADGYHRLKIAQEMEHQLTRTDATTGAINRSFFMELLEAELNRAQRYRFPLTLAHIDLANLKEVSQHLGHQAGDELLYGFIEQLSTALRANDVVARLGGDEFVVLLPQTDETQAQQVFTRIYPQLKNVLEAEAVPIHWFLGVVTFLEMPDLPTMVLEQATQLTQRMKLNGDVSLHYAVQPSPSSPL